MNKSSSYSFFSIFIYFEFHWIKTDLSTYAETLIFSQKIWKIGNLFAEDVEMKIRVNSKNSLRISDFGGKILIEESCQDADMVKHSWTSSCAKKLYLKKPDIGKLLIFCRRGLKWTIDSIPFFCMRRCSIIFGEKFLWKLLKIFCAKSCQGKLCANSSKFSRQKS